MLTLELHLGVSPLPTFTVDLACIGKPGEGGKEPGTKAEGGQRERETKHGTADSELSPSVLRAGNNIQLESHRNEMSMERETSITQAL